MPFVKAQCTNCGGSLDVDESKDAAICPFCNTPFIIEKAINLYKVEQHNHITNNIVYNGQGQIPEEKLKNAFLLIKNRDMKGALTLLDEYKSYYPNDWILWFGYFCVDNDLNALTIAIKNAPSRDDIEGDLKELLNAHEQEGYLTRRKKQLNGLIDVGTKGIRDDKTNILLVWFGIILSIILLIIGFCIKLVGLVLTGIVFFIFCILMEHLRRGTSTDVRGDYNRNDKELREVEKELCNIPNVKREKYNRLMDYVFDTLMI